MPEMTGFEVTRGLKAALRDVDVILMTGNAEEPDDNLIQAIDEGAFYFIQKPFDRRVLLALVNRCLELRRLREEREKFLRRVERELEEARQFQHQPAAAASLSNARACRSTPATSPAPSSPAISTTMSMAKRRRGRPPDRRRGRPRHVGGDDDRSRQGGVSRIPRRRFRTAGRRRANQRRNSRLRASRFVTLCCARVNTESRELTYVNAGHPQPIVRTSSPQPLLLDSTGPSPDVGPERPALRAGHSRVRPGDSILFYTDGVTEASGASGMFGTERLISMILLGDRRGPELLGRHPQGSRGLYGLFDPSG